MIKTLRLASLLLLFMGAFSMTATAEHHKMNPCNPCAMKTMGKHNPCSMKEGMGKHNPCSMKKGMDKHNPCSMKEKMAKQNPCAMKKMKKHNPCNPCKAW